MKIYEPTVITDNLESVIDVKIHTDKIEPFLELKKDELKIIVFPNYHLGKRRKVHIRYYYSLSERDIYDSNSGYETRNKYIWENVDGKLVPKTETYILKGYEEEILINPENIYNTFNIECKYNHDITLFIANVTPTKYEKKNILSFLPEISTVRKLSEQSSTQLLSV